MCGIVGIVGPDAGARRELVERMAEAIRHRGPDEGGIVDLGGAVLGTRRLAIIDVAGGHQPLSNEDGTVHVAFNGEIYDHEDHIEALTRAGHRFRTRSDTEILVHAYEERGLGLFNGLNGMFGLAIYDLEHDRLILARDRLGLKPLYYRQDGSMLSFASEMKALLVDPEIPRTIDRDSLSMYLTVETVPAPRTIFEGIFKLEPGCMVVFEKGNLRHLRYWDPRFTPGRRALDPVEALERLDHLLAVAVRRRLVSEVPLGVFLSGGLDSSTVAYYAQAAGGTVHTYNVGFTEASFDESDWARKVAGFLGTRHHEEILGATEAVDLIDQVADGLDEPFADASILPTWLLSRYTRRHVTVALGGDGGDEIFCGYPTYWAHRLIRYFDALPAFLRDRWVPRLVEALPVSRENISLEFKIRRFIAGRGLDPVERNLTWLGSFTPEGKSRVLTDAVKEALVDVDGLGFATRMLEGLEVKDPLERMIYLDMKLYMAEDILMKVDRASMAHSLEVRAPLLDYELVEFVLSLPVEYRLRGSTSKWILKDLMRDRLPPGVADRSKKGFGMPVARWIRSELREPVRDRLATSRLAEEGIFSTSEVTRLLDEHEAGVADHRKPIWTLFMFEMWYERFAA